MLKTARFHELKALETTETWTMQLSAAHHNFSAKKEMQMTFHSASKQPQQTG